MARRDEGKYRAYLTESQRRQRGCPARQLFRESRGRDTRLRPPSPLAQRPMKPSFIALLLVSAITVGCGDDQPTAPTPRSLYTEKISDVTVQAQSSGCVTFRQEAPGPASAQIFGALTPIELGTGTCTSP